ncbi:MAG: hypothetical protein R3F34_10000 [Planctomycetota bacterium]
MPGGDASARGSSERVAVLAGALVGIAFLALFRTTRSELLDGDGTSLVERLAEADTGIALWYQAAYLVLGRAVEAFVGIGRSLDALLWVSAASGAAALALCAALGVRRQGAFAGLVPALALASSPGLWLNATRVEVHATQAAGAAFALVLGTALRTGRAWSTFALAALLQFVASTSHNSQHGMAFGVAWLVARGSSARRGSFAAGAGVAVGLAGALLANSSSNPTSPEMGVAYLFTLVRNWFTGPSLAFSVDEFVLPWCPVLGLVLLVRREDLRRVAPVAVAVLPSLFFFLAYGIRSEGGYFATFAVGATVAATLASRRPAGVRRNVVALVVAALSVLGLVRSVDALRDRARDPLGGLGAARAAIAAEVLPDGGYYVRLDLEGQTVSGRVRHLHEIDAARMISEILVHHLAFERFEAAVEGRIAGAAATGLPIAIDRTWTIAAAVDTRIGPFMEEFERAVGRHYDTELVESGGVPYLVGTPRATVSR